MDVFFEFLKLYEKGKFPEALHLLVRDPDSSYDSLTSSSRSIQQLANYADSVTFGDFYDYMAAASMLHHIFKYDPLSIYKTYKFAEIIAEEDVLRRCRPEVIALMPPHRIPLPFQDHIERLEEDQTIIEALVEERPDLKPLFPTEEKFGQYAWQSIPYNLPLDVQTIGEGDIPMVLMETPESVDIKGPAVLVFETYQHLHSLLRHESVFNALIDPKNLIYLMKQHPEEQFLHQDVTPFLGKKLYPVLPRKITHGTEFFPRLATAISKALTKDSDSIAYLYNLAGKWTDYTRLQKLGISRCLAYHEKQRLQKWHNVHKTIPSQSIDMGFTFPDYVLETLQQAIRARRPPSPTPQGKIRLVHITPQIVDGTHAPSKLLRNLLYNGDRSKFDLFVITTESLQILPLDYPAKDYRSPPSSTRGAQSIALMKENGIEVWNAEPLLKIETLAQGIVNKLNDWKADIAVFHGPDAVNMLTAAMTNTPLRVMFEHGTPPEYPGFDCAILSSEEAQNLHASDLKKLGTDTEVLRFSIDVRKDWDTRAKTKIELGFPADAFIMTTISNHLTVRLNKQVCDTIAEILKRNPKAYYAPMGIMLPEDEKRLRSYFEPHGVNNRVHFMKDQPKPSQVARSMQLYLNEFPFGSGLGILDAMAAGCPVVTMYDSTGPQQGRYGGIYFGQDRAIQTGRVEDYIDLAGKLITDKKMYDEWSNHAKTQYDQRADEAMHAQNFERILLSHLKTRQ